MAPRARARSGGCSQAGSRREQNEDRYLIGADQRLFVVADGVGGNRHGEVASLLAVQAIQQSLALDASPGQSHWHLRWPRATDGRELLRGAILDAHRALRTTIQVHPELDAMRTTVVVLMLGDDHATVAHVGDSRAYRVRAEHLVRLTEDHSLAQLMYRSDVIPEALVPVHPWRHVLTQTVGGEDEPSVEVTRVAAEAGDMFLLCSDGLTEMLSEEQIISRVCCREPIEDRCRNLVEAAQTEGGRDDITVVLVAVE